MTHFPPVPPKQENLLGQLLVSPGTSNDLCWSLIEQVDPTSTIDGKSLLQVFCELRTRNHSIWTDGDFRETPLPLLKSETWPSPRTRSNGSKRVLGQQKAAESWPSPEMWVAGHLVCNGPDPLSWKADPDGKDVFDFVIQWKNPLLLDQLLRLPNAPTALELAKRRFADTGFPWLHAMARDKQDKMMDVLLHHGFPVNQPDSKGLTPLHHAVSPQVASLLLTNDADPFALSKVGKSIHQTWVSVSYEARTSHGSNALSESDLADQLRRLDQAGMAKDKPRAQALALAALFDAVLHGRSLSLLLGASARFGVPLEKWLLPDQSEPKSLLYEMSVEATRKKSSPLVSKICQLLEKTPPSARVYISRRNIPDLAFCWMAATRYGETPGEATAYRQKILDIVQQDGTPQQGYQALWRLASHLDRSKSFEGTKIDEAISKAWDTEITDLARDCKLSLPPSSPKPSPRKDAILQDPMLLPLLAKMPWDTNHAAESFCRTIEMVYVSDMAHVGPVCLLAAVSMAQNPCLKQLSTQHMAGTITFLTEQGVAWDASLPGAKHALSSLVAFAQEKIELAPLASQLQAWAMDVSTPTSQSPRAKARL